MTQPVSIGDDGQGPGAPDDGPLLAAFETWWAEMRAEMRAEREQARYAFRQALVLSQPAYAPVTNVGTIDANGNVVIDLGGPQLGRRWAVRMVTFSDAGSFFNSMGAASAALCSGQKPVGDTVVPNSVRWPFTTVPNSATFGADEMWINPADNVLLAITGGTSGQNIQCTLWIQDFDPAFIRARAEV